MPPSLQSPNTSAYTVIKNGPLETLHLTDVEKEILVSAENHVEYTLTGREEAAQYVAVLIKVLIAACDGLAPSSTSTSQQKHHHNEYSTASQSEERLPNSNTPAAKMRLALYCINKLDQVICFLQDAPTNPHVSIATVFYHNKTGAILGHYRPLLRVMRFNDTRIQRIAASCLASVLAVGCRSQRHCLQHKSSVRLDFTSVVEPLHSFVSWIVAQLQSSSLSAVTPALIRLMPCPEARSLFQRMQGIEFTTKHLQNPGQNDRDETTRNSTELNKSEIHNSNRLTSRVQQLYGLCFCLWTMTHDLRSNESVRRQFSRCGTVAVLVECVIAAPREKVVRVALSALRNLATCPEPTTTTKVQNTKRYHAVSFMTEMIGCGLMKTIDTMKTRAWSDPDILDDLNVLHELLHRNFDDMTRWELYVAEVQSGHLAWGFIHTKKFFRQNAKKLEGPDGNFWIVKKLICLAVCNDPEIGAIACFDIGEFARHYPNGRSIAKRLGAKDVVVRLIEHDNFELRWHALQSASKLLVNNWKEVTNTETKHKNR